MSGVAGSVIGNVRGACPRKTSRTGRGRRTVLESTRTSRPLEMSSAIGVVGSASGAAALVVPTPPLAARVSSTLRSEAETSAINSSRFSGTGSVTRQPEGTALSTPGAICSSLSGPKTSARVRRLSSFPSLASRVASKGSNSAPASARRSRKPRSGAERRFKARVIEPGSARRVAREFICGGAGKNASGRAVMSVRSASSSSSLSE